MSEHSEALKYQADKYGDMVRAFERIETMLAQSQITTPDEKVWLYFFCEEIKKLPAQQTIHSAAQESDEMFREFQNRFRKQPTNEEPLCNKITRSLLGMESEAKG